MMLKFQDGGNLPPFADYTPIPSTYSNPFESAGEPTTTTASKSKKDSLGLKDLFNMIKELNGLPNDSQMLAASLSHMLLVINNADSELDSSQILGMYAKFLSLVLEVKFNKERYDKAYNIIKEKDGLNEAAIIDNRLLGLNVNTKEIVYIDPTDLENIDPNVHILTNLDVLALRAKHPNMAFNNSLTDIAENGIGMEYINKIIKERLIALGNNSESVQGYTLQDRDTTIKGVKYLLEAYKKGLRLGIDVTNGMDVNGLYENELLTEDLAELALKALIYVYLMLPTNAKVLLASKTGGVESSLNLISNLITSGVSNKFQFKTNLMKDKDGNIAGGKSSTVKTVDNDPVKSFILGKGYQQPIDINVGNSYTYTVNGRFSVLTNKLGDALGANSTFEDVTKSAFSGVLDTNNATFGGIKINANQGQKILLDSSDIIGMDLPVDLYALSNGIIRPDLDMLNRLELADLKVREANTQDPNKINEIYTLFRLPPKFDADGKLNQLLYRRFARISGITEESALPKDALPDNTVFKIEDDNVRSSVEKVLKLKDEKYSMSNGLLGWGATDLYRGAIYIPVRENIIAASLGSGDYYTLPNSDATSTERTWEENKKLQTYLKPPKLSEINYK